MVSYTRQAGAQIGIELAPPARRHGVGAGALITQCPLKKHEARNSSKGCDLAAGAVLTGFPVRTGSRPDDPRPRAGDDHQGTPAGAGPGTATGAAATRIRAGSRAAPGPRRGRPPPARRGCSTTLRRQGPVGVWPVSQRMTVCRRTGTVPFRAVRRRPSQGPSAKLKGPFQGTTTSATESPGRATG